MTKVLVISAAVHVVLLVLVPLVPGLSREYDLGLDVYTVELVDLPRQEPVVEPAQAEEPPSEPPETKEEAQIPEEPPTRAKRVVLKPPSKEPERSLAERLAERLRSQDEKRPASTPPAEESAPAVPTSSATVSASRFPYSWYLSVVQGKVSLNWVQPSARLIAENALTVVVSFRIRRDGTVEAVTVRRSSGRSTLDQSATRAVHSASPFPLLPDDYRESHLDVTIDFTITRE